MKPPEPPELSEEAFGGEQYYGAGGPFSHINTAAYGMGGGYNLPMGRYGMEGDPPYSYAPMGTWASGSGDQTVSNAPVNQNNSGYDVNDLYKFDNLVKDHIAYTKRYPGYGPNDLATDDWYDVANEMIELAPHVEAGYKSDQKYRRDVTERLDREAYGGEQYQLGQEVYLDGGQIEELMRHGGRVKYI
jgi:hypothetical protein